MFKKILSVLLLVLTLVIPFEGAIVTQPSVCAATVSSGFAKTEPKVEKKGFLRKLRGVLRVFKDSELIFSKMALCAGVVAGAFLVGNFLEFELETAVTGVAVATCLGAIFGACDEICHLYQVGSESDTLKI